MRSLVPEAMLESEMQCVTELRELIGCPIDWEKTQPVADRPGLLQDLLIFWEYIASEYQSDMEMSYYSRFDVEEHFAHYGNAFSETIIRPIRVNAHVWRPRAEADYRRRVGFLEKLQFAGWETYPKHRPPRGRSRSQIINMTAGSDAISYFFDDGVIDQCERLMWNAIAADLGSFVETRSAHLFVEHKSELGACGGSPSNTMRIDFNYDNAQAHGHPRHKPNVSENVSSPSSFAAWRIQTFSSNWHYSIDCPRVKDVGLLMDWLQQRGWRC